MLVLTPSRTQTSTTLADSPAHTWRLSSGHTHIDAGLSSKGPNQGLEPSQIQELVLERRHIRRLQVRGVQGSMHACERKEGCCELGGHWVVLWQRERRWNHGSTCTHLHNLPQLAILFLNTSPTLSPCVH